MVTNVDDLENFLRKLRIVLCLPRIYVVISSSSGSGWNKASMSASTVAGKNASERWKTLRRDLAVFKSTNFTNVEASLYMKMYKIDEKWKDGLLALTGGNPLLLSYFRSCNTNYQKYYMGVTDVSHEVDKVVLNLLEMKENEVLESKLQNCKKWLMHALNSWAIEPGDMKDFMNSYIALENLVYRREDANECTFTLSFPSLYGNFIKHLKKCFREKKDAYLKSPTVQGLIFEEEVLNCLENLQIDVKNWKNELLHLEFSFEKATYQLSTLLKDIKIGVLYHLHAGHHVIDGVCVAKDVNKNEWYLLLIQVSLSTYSSHPSKAYDIRKTLSGTEDFIWEYYLKLVNKVHESPLVTDDHVVYVYASPAQTECPLDIATNRKETKYWSGIVANSSQALLTTCAKIARNVDS